MGCEKVDKSKPLLVILWIFLLLILPSCGVSDAKKKLNAEEALQNKREEKEQADILAAQDSTPPVFNCTMEEAKYEVDDNIDFTRLQMSLTATDKIDGDLTKKIVQESSTVVEHQEGKYTVTYSVKDNAGNVATFELPVVITSKYEPSEKQRLNNCVKAYNKLVKILKAPSSLRLSNINTNEEGNIIVLNYSAQNSFGAYIKGRVAYFSMSDSICDLEDEEVPANFTIGEYIYEYDDIKEFSDYYHSND
jgi:hypothetical protein